MSSELVLVTGATGFISTHVIKLLFEQGYKIRGTVRSLTDEKTIKLKEIFANEKSELELVEADLLVNDGWSEAVKGAKYVIHIASPFPLSIPNDPDVLIKPAVDGTLSVLKAASESGTVKRVVLTSSVAAVYDASLPIPKEVEETKTFNEEHWTNYEDPHLYTYSKSKTLAEKAAWDFVKELPEDKKFELVTINPGLVLGPLLLKTQSTSLETVRRLLSGSVPAVPKFLLNIADVRDVAEAHIRSLTLPDAVGHRHIIVTQNMTMKELALILQKEFKPQGYHIPTFVAPNWIVWMNSFVDKSLKMLVPRLSREFSYDNKRMREVLNITPTEVSKSIIDSAYSLIQLELVKKPKKSKKQEKEKEPETVEGKVTDEESKQEENKPETEVAAH